jgi:hypothetical protein
MLKHFSSDWIWVIDSIDGFKFIYKLIAESPAVTVKMRQVGSSTR